MTAPAAVFDIVLYYTICLDAHAHTAQNIVQFPKYIVSAYYFIDLVKFSSPDCTYSNFNSPYPHI